LAKQSLHSGTNIDQVMIQKARDARWKIAGHIKLMVRAPACFMMLDHIHHPALIHVDTPGINLAVSDFEAAEINATRDLTTQEVEHQHQRRQEAFVAA
jgi:hypothetical protein